MSHLREFLNRLRNAQVQLNAKKINIILLLAQYVQLFYSQVRFHQKISSWFKNIEILLSMLPILVPTMENNSIFVMNISIIAKLNNSEKNKFRIR